MRIPTELIRILCVIVAMAMVFWIGMSVIAADPAVSGQDIAFWEIAGNSLWWLIGAIAVFIATGFLDKKED